MLWHWALDEFYFCPALISNSIFHFVFLLCMSKKKVPIFLIVIHYVNATKLQLTFVLNWVFCWFWKCKWRHTIPDLLSALAQSNFIFMREDTWKKKNNNNKTEHKMASFAKWPRYILVKISTLLHSHDELIWGIDGLKCTWIDVSWWLHMYLQIIHNRWCELLKITAICSDYWQSK